ncbi:MAG: tail fiber domain-containing protein, partial [Bdellovibrionota bacterium]
LNVYRASGSVGATVQTASTSQDAKVEVKAGTREGSIKFHGSTHATLANVMQVGTTGSSGMGQLSFVTADAAERMRIDAAGNVGIGTNNPLTMLDVRGKISANTGTATTPGYTFVGDLDTGLYSAGANTLSLTAGGSLTMTIKANRVGINSVNPAAELDVVGDIQYTGVITDVSDARLKKDIVPLSLALPKLRKVKTYSYIMRNDPEEKPEFGVVAQELQDVFPDLVRSISTENDYLGVNYIGLIPWTIRALQELDVENQRLKAQNKELQDRVIALEKKQEEQQRMIQSIMERLDKK